MKLAVGLFGIHYEAYLKHWMDWDIYVNYKESYFTNRSILYDTVDCDFYSSTYYSDKLYELIEDYKFKGLQLQFIDNKKENIVSYNWKKRNKRFKETIQLILNSEIEYEYVLLTRYDIEITKNPIYLNVDNEKINVSCKMNINMIDDNFYFLHYSKLKSFYDTISKIDEKILSHYYHRYINDFNFLVEGSYDLQDMPVYKLLRRCI